MRRRGVSGNRPPNAGFLLVRAESGSSTEVSPRFHCAQAQCFQAFFENTVQCGEVSTPGVGWSWGSTLTPNYGGLGGGGVGTQQLSN